MDRSTIKAHLPYTLRSSEFDIGGTYYQGKVRDTYRLNDLLILVTSDRISAFDHILKQTIPFKGQILNTLAAHFFKQTTDIIPNHVLEVPDPNVTVAERCTPIPIEFVVRGYLTGHAWRVYKSGARTLCGVSLPDQLKQNSKLLHPILTPATKASEGHDEDISRGEIITREILDESTFDTLAQISLQLFQRGTEIADQRGLVLVDTKYEFGLRKDGSFCLIDEIHTPDSSRYFYRDSYERRLSRNIPQHQLSKEFVREWLMDNNFRGLPGQTLPDLPDEVRIEISARYIDLFERMTGSTFSPDLNHNPVNRIENSLRSSPLLDQYLIDKR